MIIVHFAEYASGGVATYLEDLISNQVGRNDVDKVYLIVSEYKTDKALLKLELPKLEIITYPYKRGLSGIFKIFSMSVLIRKLNPSIIHIHSSFAGLVRFKFLFSKYKKRIVYCSHGWAFNRECSSIESFLFKTIEKILSFGCARIINISKYEMNSANFINGKKMRLIYNSVVNSRSSIECNHDEHKYIKLLFIGRLDKQKGIDILLDVFEKNFIRENFKLTVAGDSVISQSSNMKDTESIRFLGWIQKERINNCINDCDILVVPSRWEGFGLVSLEAMSRGKMVLASDAGALPEIVHNGVNGFIFKTNSKGALTSVLHKVSKMSADEISKMGFNGRKIYLKKFNYGLMTNKVMDVYEEIL